MKKYLKKFSIMFVMSLILMLGCCVSAFAITYTDDGAEIGENNYNNSTNNSATKGVRLEHPEKSWKRYDDTNDKITYSDSFKFVNDSSCSYWECYKNTSHTIVSSAGKIKFSFYGTKLRLYEHIYSNRNLNSRISFDDGKTFESCTAYGTDSADGQRLYYEKTGLEKKVHSVIIDIPVDVEPCFVFDCFDIDSDGELLPYNESISLDKSTMNLTEDNSQQLTATTTPAAVGVTWVSSDPSIATIEVDPTSGKITKITALKEGTCTITATTADGSNLSASCTINVTKGTNPNPEPTGSDTIVNTAYAKGDNTNNASGGVSIIFNGDPDTTLSVVKTANVKSVWVGDNFTYTIVVTNTGSKVAKSVVINDNAPKHIQFTPSGITTTQGTVDSSSTPSNIIVNVGDIPPLGTVTITVPATVIE